MDMHATDMHIIAADEKHAGDCVDSIAGSAIGQRYFADAQYTRKLILKGIDKKEIFVATDADQTAAGFYWSAACGMFCRFPYLRLLSVKPQFRNFGVGARLLNHFEENGFAQAPKVFLAVSDFNAGAQRFYERRGYLRVGSIPDLYKPGIAEILMVKSSPQAIPS
jgi:ribosomal protein S18 acetylase RimI-like enzyme